MSDKPTLTIKDMARHRELLAEMSDMERRLPRVADWRMDIDGSAHKEGFRLGPTTIKNLYDLLRQWFGDDEPAKPKLSAELVEKVKALANDPRDAALASTVAARVLKEIE